MKLFVWEDVLRNWTSGLVCVLAEDLEQAHQKIAEKYPEYSERIPGLSTRVVTEPEAFAVHGGG